MAINIICIIIVTFTTVVDGVAVYGCYRPPGSTCANHTVSCGRLEHIAIYTLTGFTKPSNVTCPLLQDEDDCKTSVCCKYGSGDTSTRFNQQDSLLIFKKCSYQQSCSFNSPYSSSTGYDYIEYEFYCEPESWIDYIMNTTTFTTTLTFPIDTVRYLYFSHKLTPTRGLTCSCNITGNHNFDTRYIYLSGESCNSVTITTDTHTLFTCNGEDVFKPYQFIPRVNRTSIKFTSYTSNPDDVIWIGYDIAYGNMRVSCDCSNPVDGGWSMWSNTSCSVSCGKGTRKRFRHCNNPPPANGGTNCIGEGSGNIDCNLEECPVLVDGGWSTWSNTSCSVSCGKGNRKRFRHCNNPTPANGGTNCIGEGSGNIDCNLEECPGTSVNKLPWILLGVCILVVIVCAILWCIIKRVRRRRGNQPPNPTSDPTNNTSPTPDAVYYSDAVTINPLRPNDDDEIHYDNISPRYDTISPRVDYDTLSPRVDGGEGNYSALSRKKGRSKPKCTLL